MVGLIKKKLGSNPNDAYYLVNGKKIYSRLYAMTLAQQMCKTEDPNELWGKIRFVYPIEHKGPEPQKSIRELYIQRAKQLRENNEYIRIWASGGADSTNTINSFYQAGVQPDELATYVQYPGEVNASQNSEIDFSLRPFLKKVKHWWPNIKIKFYDVLPEHYNWYSKNAIEHWVAYTQLHPPAFHSQIVYELYPELQELGEKYQTADIYSGPDFFIGVDKKGWYYRFLDKGFNDSFNAPYQTYFYAGPEAKDLTLKLAYNAKKYIMKRAENMNIPFEDQILGEWGIKSSSTPEMDFWDWDNKDYDFIKKHNKWVNGLLNYGSKGSLRFQNMISTITGQTTLMNMLSFYKQLNNKNPHWFHDGNIINDWVGMRTERVYFEIEKL